jgi:hypothetical protein
MTDITVTVTVTVPVPAERTAEFYQFFGLWLAGSLSLSPSPYRAADGSPETAETSEARKLTPWHDSAQDFADAEVLWKKYSPRARAMFNLLMDNPDTKYSGDQIAQAVNIPNGAHGVAGTGPPVPNVRCWRPGPQACSQSAPGTSRETLSRRSPPFRGPARQAAAPAVVPSCTGKSRREASIFERRTATVHSRRVE